MLHKTAYKVFALSTLLAIATPSMIPPAAVFASEQSDRVFSTHNEKMTTNTEKIGTFGQTMNQYVYVINNTPNVNFANIDLGDKNRDLPKNIFQTQENAREHADYWDNTVKTELLETMQRILVFDIAFGNTSNEFVELVDSLDIQILKNKIEWFTNDIKGQKDYIVQLMDLFKILQHNLENDNRDFKSYQSTLQNILSSEGAALEQDQAYLQALLEKAKFELDYYDKWIKIPIVGDIVLLFKKNTANMKDVQTLLEEINKKTNERVVASRVVTVAQDSVNQMQQAIENGIADLTKMKSNWTDVENQYSSISKKLDKVDGKLSEEQVNIVKTELTVAQKLWNKLSTDAATIREETKELSIEK
ncbi:HBL/NHE enterotoxin family protein [Bacillus thuringiensis]